MGIPTRGETAIARLAARLVTLLNESGMHDHADMVDNTFYDWSTHADTDRRARLRNLYGYYAGHAQRTVRDPDQDPPSTDNTPTSTTERTPVASNIKTRIARLLGVAAALIKRDDPGTHHGGIVTSAFNDWALSNGSPEERAELFAAFAKGTAEAAHDDPVPDEPAVTLTDTRLVPAMDIKKGMRRPYFDNGVIRHRTILWLNYYYHQRVEATYTNGEVEDFFEGSEYTFLSD